MKGLSGKMVWAIALGCAAASLWLTGPAHAEEPVPKLGASFKDCAKCPKMVVIPGGTFLMGSNAGKPREKPAHRVVVRRFALGRYEVTFAEWDYCVTAGGCSNRLRGSIKNDEGWGRGNRPVIYVSWKDAKQYVAWLSRKTGKRFRLPSEAEWEYAARAGTRTKYWWGNAVGIGKANCNGCGSRWDKQKTAPVGSFRPNHFGLYDVHGNVWEWVEDCYNKSYAGAPSNGRPWTSSGDCSKRVLRGGSWSFNPRHLRSALRFWIGTEFRSISLGFRVARKLP